MYLYQQEMAMISLLQKINKACAELCGWMLFLVMIFLLIDIVSRFMGHPVIGVAEIAMFTVMTVIYLGLGNCEMLKGHVQVESVIMKCPPRIQKFLSIIMYILSICTISVAAWALTMNAFESLRDMESIAGLVPYPLFPVKMIMSFGLWVYCLQLVINLLVDHGGFRDEDPKGA